MGSKEKDIILNSFFYTNYNYCFLVWNFCPAKSLRKIEKIEESGLKIIYDDFDSDYESFGKISASLGKMHDGGKKTSNFRHRNF